MKHTVLIAMITLSVCLFGCGEEDDWQAVYDAYQVEMGQDNAAVIPLIEGFTDVVKALRTKDPAVIPDLADDLIIDAGDYQERRRRLLESSEGAEFDLEALRLFEEEKRAVLQGFDELVQGYVIFLDNFDYDTANEDAIPGMHELKLDTYCDKVIEEAERLEMQYSQAQRRLNSVLLDEGVELR